MWRVHVNKNLDTIFIESIDDNNIILNYFDTNRNGVNIVTYKFAIAKGNAINFYTDKESSIYNDTFNEFENKNQNSRTFTLVNFDDVKLLLDQNKLIRFIKLKTLLG